MSSGQVTPLPEQGAGLGRPQVDADSTGQFGRHSATRNGGVHPHGSRVTHVTPGHVPRVTLGGQKTAVCRWNGKVNWGEGMGFGRVFVQKNDQRLNLTRSEGKRHYPVWPASWMEQRCKTSPQGDNSGGMGWGQLSGQGRGRGRVVVCGGNAR